MSTPILPKVSLTTGKVSWTDGPLVAGADVTGFIVGLRSLTAVGSAVGIYPITSPPVAADSTTDALAAVTAALKPDDYAAAVQAQSANGPSDWSSEFAFTGVLPRPNSPTNVSVS